MTKQVLLFPTTVTDVFERHLKKHVSGAGPEAIFSSQSDGWYLQLDGMISIRIGSVKPPFVTGDRLTLTLAKALT
jgi:hypothetical protein